MDHRIILVMQGTFFGFGLFLRLPYHGGTTFCFTVSLFVFIACSCECIRNEKIILRATGSFGPPASKWLQSINTEYH